MNPTLVRLDREWDEIAASPAGDEALRRRSRTEPPLANLAHLADLLATRKAHPECAPGGPGCPGRLAGRAAPASVTAGIG